eukprot:692426-Rhodomonas_salina.2
MPGPDQAFRARSLHDGADHQPDQVPCFCARHAICSVDLVYVTGFSEFSLILAQLAHKYHVFSDLQFQVPDAKVAYGIWWYGPWHMEYGGAVGIGAEYGTDRDVSRDNVCNGDHAAPLLHRPRPGTSLPILLRACYAIPSIDSQSDVRYSLVLVAVFRAMRCAVLSPRARGSERAYGAG